LFLNFFVHFLWVALHSTQGVAGIVDGQYALESNGRIFKVLTQAEYFAHRAADLRASMALMIALYFVPMMYWWFPRSRHEAPPLIRSSLK
jgi:hypothetical protein